MTNFYKKLAMVCTTIALFTFVATSQTTIKINVGSADDDCEEYILAPGGDGVGFMDMGSSDLELTTESTGEPHYVGLIFRNVTIPAGATITNAYVEFAVDEAETCAPNLTIFGAKIATMPAPFVAGVPSQISSKPKTTATVAWPAVGPWATAGEKKQTPDIKTIIQEIIGVSGWAPGNNMMVVLTDPSEVECHQCVESWEGAEDHFDFTLAALLSVTYTAGVGVADVYGSSVSIYPNPTTGKVTVKNPSSGKFGYAIYNVIGKVVKSRDDIAGSSAEVDMSSSAKGTYFVEVKSDAKTLKSKLILK